MISADGLVGAATVAGLLLALVILRKEDRACL